jgi:lysophospholipase L1-like esterase
MDKLLTLLLAPWLLWQARRVRRYALRLPEASGLRNGVYGSGPPLGVLVLGDSAAAGVGCASQSEAITGHWLNHLASRYRVHWQLLAQSGLNCAQVLQLLKSSPVVVNPVDTVLLSVGVNDVTGRTSPKKWLSDLEQMTGYLRRQLGVKIIIYTALPPMQRFPALPQPLRWFLGRRAGLLDALLKKHCRQHAGLHHVQIELPFDAEFIASDGFHPSSKGAQVWAQAVAKIYLQAKA